jgi:hypothetical protein
MAMKTKLLLALSLFPSVTSATTTLPEIPILEGYVEIRRDTGSVDFEFDGETAHNLYIWFPGSSIIRPDKVCSRGLKVPPTVKRTGGVRCERYVSETGQTATYKCFARMDIVTGKLVTLTEEYICGLPRPESIKTPEEEDKDFQKILNGAPPIGYPLVQLNGVLSKEKVPIHGYFGVWVLSAEFTFSDETAKMLFEAMPKKLTVPKEKACTESKKVTVRRTDGLRCLRTPSPDKKSANYNCFTRFDPKVGWIEAVSEEVLCNDGGGGGDAEP